MSLLGCSDNALLDDGEKGVPGVVASGACSRGGGVGGCGGGGRGSKGGGERGGGVGHGDESALLDDVGGVDDELEYEVDDECENAYGEGLGDVQKLVVFVECADKLPEEVEKGDAEARVEDEGEGVEGLEEADDELVEGVVGIAGAWGGVAAAVENVRGGRGGGGGGGGGGRCGVAGEVKPLVGLQAVDKEVVGEVVLEDLELCFVREGGEDGLESFRVEDAVDDVGDGLAGELADVFRVLDYELVVEGHAEEGDAAGEGVEVDDGGVVGVGERHGLRGDDELDGGVVVDVAGAAAAAVRELCVCVRAGVARDVFRGPGRQLASAPVEHAGRDPVVELRGVVWVRVCVPGDGPDPPGLRVPVSVPVPVPVLDSEGRREVAKREPQRGVAVDVADGCVLELLAAVREHCGVHTGPPTDPGRGSRTGRCSAVSLATVLAWPPAGPGVASSGAGPRAVRGRGAVAPRPDKRDRRRVLKPPASRAVVPPAPPPAPPPPAARPPANNPPAAHPTMNILRRYNDFLTRRPLVANMLMSGTLFGAGDVIAQLLFIDADYDYLRTARNSVYGGLIFAPIASHLYRGLNSHVRFPRWGKLALAARAAADTLPGASARPLTKSAARRGALLDTAARVAVDQLCWSPVGIALYFSCMGAMEGEPAAAVAARLHEGWWETLVTNWRVWPLLQLVNFQLVPVAHRLAVVNVASVVWNTYMSYENWRAGASVHRHEAADATAGRAAAVADVASMATTVLDEAAGEDTDATARLGGRSE